MIADRWMEKGPKGREVILGERIFEQVTTSAVPLDPVTVRTLRRSPLALDLYAWLTHRMATLDRTATVRWPSLEAQFGSEYARPRDFRAKFRKHLASVSEAWPGQLQVEASERRVVLDRDLVGRELDGAPQREARLVPPPHERGSFKLKHPALQEYVCADCRAISL